MLIARPAKRTLPSPRRGRDGQVTGRDPQAGRTNNLAPLGAGGSQSGRRAINILPLRGWAAPGGTMAGRLDDAAFADILWPCSAGPSCLAGLPIQTLKPRAEACATT